MMDADGTPRRRPPDSSLPLSETEPPLGKTDPRVQAAWRSRTDEGQKPTPVLSGRRQLAPPTGRCRPGAALGGSLVPPGLTQPGPAPGPSHAAHSSKATQRDLTPMRTTMRMMTMTNKIRITSIFRFFFWYCSAL